MTDLQTIKSWFRTRCKPTQAQFWETFDSFWHKAEGISVTAINGLMDILNSKAAADHNHDNAYAPKNHTHPEYLTEHQDVSGKADKVSSPTSGNFAGVDSNGNITDSGSKASDFQPAGNYAPANHSHAISDVTNLQAKLTKLEKLSKAALVL